MRRIFVAVLRGKQWMGARMDAVDSGEVITIV